jgi:hypothetical protein
MGWVTDCKVSPGTPFLFVNIKIEEISYFWGRLGQAADKVRQKSLLSLKNNTKSGSGVPQGFH